MRSLISKIDDTRGRTAIGRWTLLYELGGQQMAAHRFLRGSGDKYAEVAKSALSQPE
jgi:hypothetical protein